MFCIKLIGLVMVLGVSFVFGEGVRSGKAEVDLLVRDSVVKAGGETVVGVRLRPDKGWHSYWKNPGEMGMPTSVEWVLPKGVTVGELEFPAPHLFLSSGIKSLGYEGEVVLLAKVTVGEGVKAGPVSVKAKVSWLTCTADACVPGDGEVGVMFEVGEKAELSGDAGVIAKTGERMPVVVKGWKVSHLVKGKKFVVRVKLPDGVVLGDVDLYVVAGSLVNTGEKVVWTRDGDVMVGEVGVSEYFEEVPAKVEMVFGGGKLRGARVVVSDLVK